ncbi:MAG: hypothetical protein ACTS3T_11710 [Almyronema sp.]
MQKLLRALLLPGLIAFLVAEMLLVSPAMAQSAASDSLCYMQTESGTIVDLSEFCGSEADNISPPTTNTARPAPARNTQPTYPGYTGSNGEVYAQTVSYPEPPNVYDYGAIRAFDRQLYGD